MKVLTIDTFVVGGNELGWNTMDAFDTNAFNDQLGGARVCEWAGIAIGPESDEGRVRVNGVVLQAGRVLPLRDSNYRVERVIGSAGNANASKRLQLVLFECTEELAAEVARGNGRYINEPTDTGVDPLGVIVDDAYSDVLVVPFTGRRQCLFTIDDIDLTQDITYRVVGNRWSSARDAYESYVLVQVGDTFGNPGAADNVAMPIAFYIGGTNEAECWDFLTLQVASGVEATSGNIVCEAETIGEIGAR